MLIELNHRFVILKCIKQEKSAWPRKTLYAALIMLIIIERENVEKVELFITLSPAEVLFHYGCSARHKGMRVIVTIGWVVVRERLWMHKTPLEEVVDCILLKTKFHEFVFVKYRETELSFFET